MPSAEEQIISVFKEFAAEGLIGHDQQKLLYLVTDDIIGIGMGEQGIVTCKADVARIMGNEKSDNDNRTTELEYDNIQVRCYEDRYATICAVIKVKVTDAKKAVVSTLGQNMSMRKVGAEWKIYALQATPIFEQIEELEAYPIKFAENVLEAYRQQEKIAQNAYVNSVAIYLVNYTKGIFESATLKNDIVIQTEKGEPYESVIFWQARKHLKEEERYQFISKFSLGNVLNSYQNGETELSMEYEMIVSEEKSVWMRTIIKLYVDKADENLKGYLYVIDIDREKRHELEMQNKVDMDTMTGLYNKKSAESKIAMKLKTAYAAATGCFFMIDLDHFKVINDTYGHREGDRVIKSTADCITSMLRKNDIAGRLGGDEFCIYFHDNITCEEAIAKAEYLCEYVRNLVPSKENGISCSIGIVFCSGPDMSFDEIYQNADQALYEQKRNGRDGYTAYKDR